jgi:PBP1b-binding outer membrane lipoprotein LpoB
MMYRDLTTVLLAMALLAGCSEESTDSAGTEATSPEPAMTTQPAMD